MTIATCINISECISARAKTYSTKDQNPNGYRRTRTDWLSGGPSLVDGRVRRNSVSDIVGAMSERSSASSEDLKEGEDVFGLVGVDSCSGVHFS